MIKTYETYSHLNDLRSKMEDLVRAISKLQTDLRGINTLHSYCN
jgi:hypothetical protein